MTAVLGWVLGAGLANAGDAAPERPHLPTATRDDHSRFIGGVPLGGIGTGSVELRADGSFREWQIFNNWGNALALRFLHPDPSYDLLNAFAALAVDGHAYALETSPPPGLPGVESIAYDGRFPFAELTYTLGNGVPLTATLEACGSFAPHRLDDSGIPAFGLSWRFTNTSDRPLHLSLALSLANPLGEACAELQVGALRIVESMQGRSGLALAALDGQARSIAGGADSRATLDAFWQGFSADGGRALRGDGHGARVAQIVDFTLPPHGQSRQRFVVGWFFPDHHENGSGPLIGHRYEAWCDGPAAAVALFATRFDALRSASDAWRSTLADASWPDWITHWLTNIQYTFAKTSWWVKNGDFMTYESQDGCPNGSPVHIIDLADWAVVDCFSTLELALLRRFADHQHQDGRIDEQFNSNEPGLGGGPSATTFGGRDLTDIAPKFCVEIFHRWRETGDRAFLDAVWPAVRKAAVYSRKFDAMHVGLPSGPDLSSTWDHWNNRFLPSYNATVYLAGLKAAEALATVEGDSGFAAQAHAWFAQGLATMDQKLWNGQFYAITTDQAFVRNDLSFVESTYGDIFSRLVGLGPVLADDRSLSSLRAIATLNSRATRWGLVNSADRDGKMVLYAGDRRCDITICHTIPAPIGLIQAGDVDTGLRLLKGMYDLGTERHPGGLWNLPHHVISRTGERNFDDFGRYLRDRALWALLKVLNGWSYDAPAQTLALGPVLTPSDCRGPWITATAYGTLAQQVTAARQHIVLACKDGALALRELDVTARIGRVGTATVTLDGATVVTTLAQHGERVELHLAMPISLTAAQTLEIQLW